MRAVLLIAALTFSACKSWGKFWVTDIVYQPSSLLLTQNVAMGTVTPSLPNTATSCTATPALPTGLALDAATCAISGTPTKGQPPLTHKISASIGSDAVSGEITIRVLFQPRFVYSANSGTANVSKFVIQSGGSLSTAVNYAAGTGPRFARPDPYARFLYVANHTAGTISVFPINQADGSLATEIAGSPFGTAANPYSLVFDPQGRFLYVGHESTGVAAVSAYTVNNSTGVPTPVSGSPFPVAAGSTPVAVYPDPSGKFLYVGSSQSTTNAHAFAINQVTGALTQLAGSPYTTINDAISVFVHPSGNYVYYAQYFSPIGAVGLNRNTTTGALSLISGSPFLAGSAPGFVTGDLAGKFIYVANSGDAVGTAAISGFTVGATGALTDIPGSPFTAGQNPIGFGIDETGQYAYSANSGSNNVTGFKIDATTGVLTQVSGSPYTAGTSPFSIAVCGSNQ